MPFRLVALWAVVTVTALPHGLQASNRADSFVTVQPACPGLTVDDNWSSGPASVTIRYNPRLSNDRLKPAQNWSLVIADSIGSSQLREHIVPMTRLEDGGWEVSYKPDKIYGLGYSMFFFRADSGRIDNNRGQYWEILHCFHSEIISLAIDMQAATYEGRLLAPGIQRTPDLDHAIAILEADLKRRPDAGSHYFYLWDFELKKGRYSAAAYAQVGAQMDSLISAKGTQLSTMQQILGFFSGQQCQLPQDVVQRFRRAWSDLPQTAEPIALTDRRSIDGWRTRVEQQVRRGLAQLDYSAIDVNEKDPRKKAEAYLAFAAKYPPSPDLPNANPYGDVFFCEKKLGDVAAAEEIFEKWAASTKEPVQPDIEMAKFYLERKIKPARVLELLSAVNKIYVESDLPTSHHHFRRDPGELEALRGQAHLLLNDLPAARADFGTASAAAPDNPSFADQLGQICEQMGDTAGALAAYLSAASAPYELNSKPAEAFRRIFVAQGMGTSHEAEKRIARQAGERISRTASAYTPVAMNQPAPDFAFTDLRGTRFDSQTTKGKPTVITFWGIWCPPCIAELPAIQEFQNRHFGVNMLAVEVGNTPDEVKKFLAAHKLNSLHVASQAEWPEAFGASGAPTSLVLDKFGQIQFNHAGKLADVEAILGKDLSTLPGLN